MGGVDEEQAKRRWQRVLAAGVLLLVTMNVVLFIKFGLRRPQRAAPPPPAVTNPVPVVDR
jgi:hypothetical protein